MKYCLSLCFTLIFLLSFLSCATDAGQIAEESEQMAAEVEEQLESTELTDVEVVADEQGVHIITTGLLFEPESAVMTETITAQLDELGAILMGYEHDILVEGHSAKVGAESAIQALSDARAKAIADYLAQKGYVPQSRITSVGKGASEPVASNDTKEGRAQNRRVEITILN